VRAYTQPGRLRVCIRNLLCVPVGVAVAVASTGAIAGAPNPPDDEVFQAIEADPSPAEGTNHSAMSGAMPKTTVEATAAGSAPTALAPHPTLDPAARLLSGDAASEYWTLYIELESGHRIAQRFLLTNVGPGDHSAVAMGHLIEPGRDPYSYLNGRRRARWKLSGDRLFFDIGASHLDLHRPNGELRITKDDIEIRLFFDFSETDLARRVPPAHLPKGYHVDVLAIAAKTRGSIHAPWMSEPLETRGRTWLAHTWTQKSEAAQVDRRVEIYGFDKKTSFYGIQFRRGKRFGRAWGLAYSEAEGVIESLINVPTRWVETQRARGSKSSGAYPVPDGFDLASQSHPGQITLGKTWLHFDPLEVIPQPFRWFIRRKSKPQQVWADAEIGVRLSEAPENPPLPEAGETESDSNSKRETEEETALRSVTGVASITFMNPID
jgi:hypothetical protein